jgi:hypothetical protein
MTRQRQSKRLFWEILILLEEAGEEDICSMLNEVMGAQRYFGSGADLAEYLDALAALEARGDLRVREYQIEDGRTTYLGVAAGAAGRPLSSFRFDVAQGIWVWSGRIRQMAEVTAD